VKKRFILKDTNRLELPHTVAQWLLALSKDALPYEIVAKPYRRNRRIEQNDFYWTLLTHISQETGYTKDDLHDMMRYKFLGMQQKEVAGVNIEYLPSTTKLKVGEMADYLTQIEQWASQLGIWLPAREER
jgi:hypothetical protein